MAKSLEQVLGYVALTGTIQQTTMGIPNPLPPGFMNIKKPTIGDSARYTVVKGTRTTARLAMYGSPAVKRALKDVAYQDVKLMHTFEETDLNPLVLQQLRNYNNYDVQRLGMEEVARQMANFKQNFVNLRIAAVEMALANGKIWWDGSGNLLPTSSGAVVTVDLQIPSSHQSQLALLANSANIIANSWDSAVTDIPDQLRVLKQVARQESGYPIKYAIYGANVPSYLTNNDFVSDYLSRNPSMQAKFLESADLPDGLFGLTWIPAYEAFYEDSSGNNQVIFGNDTVVFTPEVSPEWYEMLEGTYMVPTTLNILQGDAAAAVGSMRQVTGMFGYSQVTANPPGIKVFTGDTFCPIIKVPKAIYQSVVKF